jgi:hypothetical protein
VHLISSSHSLQSNLSLANIINQILYMNTKAKPEDRPIATEAIVEGAHSDIASVPYAKTTAESIAEKYEIPPITLTTREQAGRILSYCNEAETGAHLFSSYDKLGNLPASLFRTREDRAAFLAAMDNVLANPMEEAYRNMDKIERLVGDNNLPENLRKNMARIIMEEGDKPPLDLFRIVQAELIAHTEMKPVDAISKVRNEIQPSFRQNDRPRQEAVLSLLKQTYPQLKQHEKVAQGYLQIRKVLRNYDDDNRFNEVVQILEDMAIDSLELREKITQLKTAKAASGKTSKLESEIGKSIEAKLLEVAAKLLD